MDKVAIENSVNVQEQMWIEIIQRMEHVYAELAHATVGFEKKNLELVEANELRWPSTRT